MHMYLERIEMTGFKSFADKTVIEFDRGMTAVVGPNGSGKSNLSEAIRWVLGEQSVKSLRGNRMEDVIFNGTQNRKPVNLAKVTLVLNNEDRYLDYDFSEISITRSYNRNGESQYFINKESVRLKDIVDMLLDSGLGKNSFSMISQGKVETIFLNKPEERRSIFEEAAGVQKYQYRKNEAERKLLRSTDHLSRVKDIIHEIEGQLKPLKGQREAALMYQEKKESLRQLEISLYTYQIEKYRLEWRQAEKDLKILNQKMTDLEKEQADLTEQLTTNKAELDVLNEKIDTQSDAYQQEAQEVERLKARQQMIEQQIKFNEISQNDKQSAYEEQLAQQADTKQTIKALTENRSELGAALKEMRQKLEQAEQDKQALSGLDAEQIEEVRSQLIDWYQQETSANNRIQQHQQALQQQADRMSQSQIQLEQVSQQLAETSLTYEAAKVEVDADQLEQSIQRQQFNQLLEQVQLTRQKREQQQQQLFQQERETQTLDSKLTHLQQLQESYSGYYAGVRSVMTQSKKIAGIIGPVANLIEVAPEYQLAIDTALGGSLQHIVVTDDRAAKEAIQYLKQNQAGRATFLPQPHIKSRSLSQSVAQQAERMEGFVGIGHQLVKTDNSNQAIVANLLGTTVIMAKLDDANRLARQLNHSVKIVTLEGEVLMPGGSISGGRNRQQQSSMLARQNEIKTVKLQLITAQTKLQELDKAWKTSQSDEQSYQQQVDTQREALNQQQTHGQQLQQKVYQLEQQLKQFQTQELIVQDELTQSQELQNESISALSQAESDQNTAKAAIESTTQLLEQHSLSQEERQRQLQILEQKLSQLKTDVAVKELEQKQVVSQLSASEEQLNGITQFLNHYQTNQSHEQLTLFDLQEEFEELTKEQATASERVIQLKESLTTFRERRQTLNDSIRKQDQLEREQALSLQQTFQKQANLTAQVEKFEVLIDNQLEYLNEEYQLSYEAAIDLARPIDSVKQINQTVKQLKRDINQLGPINLASIEDYDLLNERYLHLSEQQDDLLTAMSQLKETMNEMDSEVIKRFGETFQIINKQFQLTFRKLFGGGNASLQLTDPKDLLMTGVDIVAQPPGKKKQNLALLSGGERAFTAIALLFAILETKPVPFCVLDEVEAALDEANVYRYGEYLQSFTENTQFIVITHRKGTMEHADVLYGVTMEQSGISKLASVKLSQMPEA